MASFFTKLFGGKGSSVIGIDMGSSAIKVVQLKKKGGKAVLETYGSLAVGTYAGKAVGQSVTLSEGKKIEALKNILTEAETTTRVTGLAIPFQSSLMSVVKMPTNDRNKLNEMVPIEARKYIPVPITEISLDWMMIPSSEPKARPGEKPEEVSVGEQETEILLVAIHNKVMSSLQNLSQKAELDTQFYEIEIFSTIRSIVGDTAKPALVFDMGAASTKLYLVQQGVIHGSHTINRGSQDITTAIASAFNVSFADAEKIKRGRGIVDRNSKEQMKEVVAKSLGYIFADTQRALESFETKYGQKIETIYFVGGGSTLKGLKELAENRLKKTIVKGDAFAKIETPDFITNVLSETGPEFAVATGAALRGLDAL